MTPCRKADVAMRESRFDDARALYEQAAAAGDLRAWRGLAWMAQKGYGQPVSLARALECYEKGAVGDASCAYNTAALLAQGVGGETRKAEVLGWYERALELGHATVLARIALTHKEGLGTARDPERAETLFRRAIHEGISEARIYFGRWLVERGEVVAAARQFLEAHVEGQPGFFKELGPVLEALRKLATEGDGEAQYIMGVRHLLAKEVDEGMRWIRSSADGGNPAGLRALGFAHHSGQGAPQDPDLAGQLFERAAQQGDAQAQFNVVHLTLGQTDDPKAKQAARELLEQSARQGNGSAMAMLGAMLVHDAPEEAREWLRLSAQRGNVASMIALGRLYRDGLGGSADTVQAARWFISARRKGNADAVHEMHDFVKRMTPDEIREAARRAGDVEDAESWIALRSKAKAAP